MTLPSFRAALRSAVYGGDAPSSSSSSSSPVLDASASEHPERMPLWRAAMDAALSAGSAVTSDAVLATDRYAELVGSWVSDIVDAGDVVRIDKREREKAIERMREKSERADAILPRVLADLAALRVVCRMSALERVVERIVQRAGALPGVVVERKRVQDARDIALFVYVYDAERIGHVCEVQVVHELAAEAFRINSARRAHRSSEMDLFGAFYIAGKAALLNRAHTFDGVLRAYDAQLAERRAADAACTEPANIERVLAALRADLA